VSFGHGRARRSIAIKIERRGQGGSPVQVEENRQDKRKLVSPSVTESSEEARRCCGVAMMGFIVFDATRAKEQR
jgi:hypothetical protein